MHNSLWKRDFYAFLVKRDFKAFAKLACNIPLLERFRFAEDFDDNC